MMFAIQITPLEDPETDYILHPCGPGYNLVSRHGDGWCEALNFSKTTNQKRFAKLWASREEAAAWAAKHNPNPDKFWFEIINCPVGLLGFADDYHERIMER